MSQLEADILNRRAQRSTGHLDLRWTDGVWISLQQIFGILFCATLIGGLLYFPFLKKMPMGYAPVLAGGILAFLITRKPVRRRVERVIMHGSSLRFLTGLLLIAAILRVVTISVAGLPPVSDHADYHSLAVSIATGNGFGTQGHTPPGTPLLLAVFYSLLTPSVWVGQLAQVVTGCLFILLSYSVARKIIPEAASRAVAIMTAFFPGLVLYSTVLCYSIPLGCLWMLALWLFLRKPPAFQKWYEVVLIGIVIGALCLVKPIGLIFPGVFTFFYWRRKVPPVRSIGNGILITIGMAVALAPWTYRNYKLFGAFSPVVTSSGIGLWVTNHPGAGPQTCAFPDLDHFSGDRIARDKHLRQVAINFLKEHPEHLVTNFPGKAAYMWGTSSSIMAFVSADRWSPTAEKMTKGAINLCWAFVCFLFVVSAWKQGFFRSTRVFYPVAGSLAVLWGIHIVFEAQSKYHLPLMPILFMGAALALLNQKALVEETRKPEDGPSKCSV